MARARRTSAASETSTVTDLHHHKPQQQELNSLYDYLVKIILLGPSGTGKSCLLHRFVKSEWRVLSSQTIGVEFASKIVKIGQPPRRRRVKLQLWDTAGTERFRSVSRSYYRGAAGAILVYDVGNQGTFGALGTFLSDARALASPGLVVVLAGNKVDLTGGGEVGGGGMAEGEGDQPQVLSQSQGQSSEPPPTPSSVSSRGTGFPFDAGGSVGTSSLRSRAGSLIYGPKWTATVSTEGREVAAESASRWASKSGIPVAMEVSALSGENVEELFTRLARTILTKIELGEIDPDDPQSGIQYGDGGGGGWDGSSVRSGTTQDESARYRTRRGKGSGGGILAGVSEWEEVFKLPGSRSGRRCC